MGRRILALTLASASALRPGSKPRSALVPRSTLHRAAALRRSATTLRSTLSRDDATVEDMLTQQLGYSPPNLVEVAAWTAAGTPAVIRAHPLLSRRGGVEPFPTTYWLTCPQIKAAVGTVERDQGVKRAAAHLADEAGEAAMRAAHASYAADRWGLLSEAEADLVEERGWSGVLRSVGVAGLRDPTTVKCLHAHYAHWLGTRENPVGAWVHAHLPDDVRAFAAPDLRD
jgi:hypothetical protein